MAIHTHRCAAGASLISWNATGPTGASGPKGNTGATGQAGPKGNAGAAGPKGDTGATGPAGSRGDNGATGPAGPQGSQGLKGDQGIQGPKGDTGAGFGTTFTWTGSSTTAPNAVSAEACIDGGGTPCPTFYISKSLPTLTGSYAFSPQSTICFNGPQQDVAYHTIWRGGVWIWDGTNLTKIATPYNPYNAQPYCVTPTLPAGIDLSGDKFVFGGNVLNSGNVPGEPVLNSDLSISLKTAIISVPPSTSIN